MDLIIVGVDGNEPSERAARAAAQLAKALEAQLHVVCAYTRDEVARIDAGDGEARFSVADESAAIASDVAARVTLDAVRTTSSAAQGRPADVLVAEAERLGATLIVVGNKRVQGVARALGSIAGSVAHRAPCDVYVAHTS